MHFRSFNEDVFITSVSTEAVLEIHHGDELVTRQQLSGRWVNEGNVLTWGIVGGVPCVVTATCGEGKGSGVYIHHAMNGRLMRSLPFRENVYCVCIDRSGTCVVFGTESGAWVKIFCMIRFDVLF